MIDGDLHATLHTLVQTGARDGANMTCHSLSAMEACMTGDVLPRTSHMKHGLIYMGGTPAVISWVASGGTHSGLLNYTHCCFLLQVTNL